MMNIRPIRNERDYDWALAEITRYFNRPPKRGTPQADRFDVLAELIEAYEAKHWAIGAADPVDAIIYSMDINGRTQGDLAALFGSKSRASEILGRKRPLTLGMIQKLNRDWGLPAELLIAPGRFAVQKVA